jgi:hypothetical protein
MESVVKDIPESMKLEGQSNYTIWAFRIRQILQRKRVWKFVELPSVAIVADTGESSGTSSQ